MIDGGTKNEMSKIIMPNVRGDVNNLLRWYKKLDLTDLSDIYSLEMHAFLKTSLNCISTWGTSDKILPYERSTLNDIRWALTYGRDDTMVDVLLTKGNDFYHPIKKKRVILFNIISWGLETIHKSLLYHEAGLYKSTSDFHNANEFTQYVMSSYVNHPIIYDINTAEKFRIMLCKKENSVLNFMGQYTLWSMYAIGNVSKNDINITTCAPSESEQVDNKRVLSLACTNICDDKFINDTLTLCRHICQNTTHGWVASSSDLNDKAKDMWVQWLKEPKSVNIKKIYIWDTEDKPHYNVFTPDVDWYYENNQRYRILAKF